MVAIQALVAACVGAATVPGIAIEGHRQPDVAATEIPGRSGTSRTVPDPEHERRRRRERGRGAPNEPGSAPNGGAGWVGPPEAAA
jgi:hypothetical protein